MQVAAATAALGASLLVLVLRSWLWPSPHPTPTWQYPITSFVLDNYTWGVAAVLLLVGGAVGYVSRSNPIVVGAGFILFQFGAICYEVQREPTSHNLLPFDIFGSIVFALPLVLGGYLGRRMRAIQ